MKKKQQVFSNFCKMHKFGIYLLLNTDLVIYTLCKEPLKGGFEVKSAF